MPRKICTLLLFTAIIFIISTISSAQEPSLNLTPPIREPLFLSGSFGEIRTSHFHSGIDFRTGGRIGFTVYASEDGFVSRIRVGGTGFGKALYIEHPNGVSTVYAHLDQFNSTIEPIVKEEQYRRKSFEVDIYLKRNEVRVKRGEKMGLSGNTGSSGGPHLHYEVRKSANQKPINPAFSNLPINDHLPPVVRSAYMYILNPESVFSYIAERVDLSLATEGTIHSVRDTIYTSGAIAFGVEAYDYVNRSSLRCGIYSLEMDVNDTLWYQFKMDGFLFSETRYVNSHIDYELRQLTGRRAHRLLIDSNNKFSGYGYVRNRGVIDIAADSLYNINIAIGDPYGNSSQLRAVVKGVPSSNRVLTTPDTLGTNSIGWYYNQDNVVQTNIYRVSVPRNSLYRNLLFTHSTSPAPKGYFSPVVHIHNRLTPLHTSYWLSIAGDSVPTHLRDKALLATFTPKGEIEAAGGRFSNGAVKASLREFGDYFIAIDTIPPTITPLNIRNGKNMSGETMIRFRVKDDLSGVASITGTINGNWALFEHDPKEYHVFYIFDEERLPKNSNHNLTLTVEDEVGNSSVFTCDFVW